MTVRSSASLDSLQGVQIDVVPLTKDNYIDTAGSTIITLTAAYLNALPTGAHTVRINSTGGYAETTFTIVEAAAPAPTPSGSTTPSMDVTHGDGGNVSQTTNSDGSVTYTITPAPGYSIRDVLSPG